MNDLISRQAAIDALDVLCQEHRYKIPGKRETYSQYNEAWQDALDRAEGVISNLPPAQPMRKKGKWTKEYSYNNEWGDTVERLRCSICGSEHSYCCGATAHDDDGWFDFCPYCGADMKRRPK